MAKKKEKRFFTVILQLMIIINIIFVTRSFGSDFSNPLPVDTPAPDFSLTDIVSNESFSLTDFQGKVVILDLFATWCGPCLQAIPQIREFYLSYSADDLIIISIDVDETDLHLSKDFILERKMEWLVAFDNNSGIDNNYGTTYIPTLYVIDQNQVIAYSEIGFNFKEVLNALDQLGLEPTRPIFSETSSSDIFFPLIYITGIGLMVIFIVGAVIYGRYQQKKQAQKYQSQYVFDKETKNQAPSSKIAVFKVCPNCNRSLTSEAKFCSYCGSDL